MKTNIFYRWWLQFRFEKGLVIVASVLLLMICNFNAKAQQILTIEWEYTVVGGCARMPLDILLLGAPTPSADGIRIYKDPGYTYPGSGYYYNYTSLNSFQYYGADTDYSNIWVAVGYKNDQGKCPGLMGGLPCYKDGLTYFTYSKTDYCQWKETTVSVCGFSNFKVRINVSPSAGTPVIQQGTPKPMYCSNEAVTFEVPCNLKGKSAQFSWYKKEGAAGAFSLVKTGTSETLTVGEGQDLVPKAGVSTYVYVRALIDPGGGTYYLQSDVSGGVRFGAHAPTVASIDPKPPKCADGNDWAIHVTGVSSVDAAVTSFKANIFHATNGTAFPDGYVTFSGGIGVITKDNIFSARIFVPGTQFRIVVQNDYDPTNYGSCETAVPGTYTIANTPKIAITENTGGHKNLSCFNVLTGEMQLNVVNGDGSYTVKLNDVDYAIKAGSPVHQPVVAGLDGGTYTVKLKDTNCEADPITVILTEPALLTANITIEKSLDCANSIDGQLKVNVAGGTMPYSINWSNGNTTAVATGLSKGTHTVSVVDQGCPLILLSQELTAPDPILITLADTPPKCPGGTDGRMQVSNLQNAPGTIEYLWNTGETSSQLSDIGKGNYTVTVTSKDAGKTCSASASKELMDPDPWTATLKPALPFNGSAISCNGEDDGKIDVDVKNNLGQDANGEFYSWSNGVSGASAKFIDNLPEGTYSVKVRYNGVCEATASYTLLDPDAVTPIIEPNSNYNGQLISCFDKKDAALKVKTIGGTGSPASFIYKWSTGDAGTTLAGLRAGSYDVTVTDVNGCVGKNSYTIANPELVEASVVTASDYHGFGISCAGLSDGFISANASGGTEVFAYAWSNGKTTPSINGLPAGSYTLTAKDNNGCTAVLTHTVTAPTPVSINVSSSKDVSCFNGNDGVITLQAGGGAASYEFSRNNTSWQSSPTFATLSVGTYTLYARDQNLCTVNISKALTQPSKINISFSNIEPAFCASAVGKASAVVSGGVTSYQYKWVLDGQSQVISTTDKLANVAAGIYRVIVTDGNSCVAENTVPITSTDGAQATFSAQDTKCFDSSDGSALVNITSGDGPFIVKWPDGQTSLQAINLAKGLYDVTITDAHSCTVIKTVEVKGPLAMDVSVQTSTIPTCNASCDGAMTLNTIGGVGGYVYQWNNATGATQINLCAGTYAVVVKDGNGCVAMEEVVLSQPEPLMVEASTVTLPTCRDGCDGALQVLATGGNGGYQYTWAVGGNSNVKTSLCPGNYAIAIKDVKGCTGNGIVQLPNAPELPLNLGGGVTLCVGQAYTLDAGNNWNSVSWGSSTGITSTDPSIVVNAPGNYWVDVTDDKGCFAQDTFLLETSFDLLKAQFMLTSEAVVGDTVVAIEISWPPPQSIVWDFPEEMEEIYNAGDVVMGQFGTTGTYDVTLTAHLGECVDKLTKSIIILERPEGNDGGRLGYEKFVKSFTLFPNPNDGRFDVGVELIEDSEITLSIWNATNLKFMGKISDRGAKDYLKHIDLRPLSAGVYVLQLEHKKGKQYIRFIVE